MYCKAKISTEKLQAYKRFMGSTEGLLCKAPYSSLYFNPDGRVTPCCVYDRNMAWGFYPAISIDAILKSKLRRKLQKKIRANCLDYGCTLCEYTITSNNFEGVIARQYENHIIDKHYPYKLEFELSHYCNLDCIMCGTHNRSGINQIYCSEKFLEDIDPCIYHARQCSFYGGEPFLNDVYFKLWSRLNEVNKGCIIYVQTNGTICNEKILSLIENKNIWLGVSIDALSEPLYNKIRSGGNLKLVLENIEKFSNVMRSNKRHLSISVCPMPLNIEEIPLLWDFVNSLHAEIYFNTVNFPRNLSFALTPSKTLLKYNDLLDITSRKTFDNPHSDINKKRLDSLRQMILQYADRNKTFEETILPQPVDAVILSIEKSLGIKKHKDLFSEIFRNTKSRTVSPLVIGDLNALGLPLLKKTIISHLKNHDFETIKKIIAIE